jgi:hypothetical protein
LDSGGPRPPIRAALIRFWARHKILRVAVPLTGATALRAETPFELSAWLPAFLRALATEAADGRQLLMDLERAWFAARSAVAGRRRDSHAAAAVDLLAATPLISATSLAAGLGITISRVPSGCWTAWSPSVSPSRLRADRSGGCSASRAWHRSARPCDRPTGPNRDAGAAGHQS